MTRRRIRESTSDVSAGQRRMLDELLAATLTYFERETNLENGLIADRSEPGSPASIAAMGFGLSSYVVAVERRLMTREAAIERTLAMLRFLAASPQSEAPDATGYKGFYYHFLDMKTGCRAPGCELTTIDTALLMAGVLSSAVYFRGAAEEESEIRELADALYRRVDWAWASDASGIIGHGWTPEGGRLASSWDRGYSEALILYVLALGSPTFPISAEGYQAWTATFEEKTFYGISHLYAGPLFIHQFSQMWLDCRGIMDDRSRAIGHDYFENSRRATLVQREYAIENPHGFAHYAKDGWGFTACDGPGPDVRIVKGVRREFFAYLARGAPLGPDDGTISPWAVVASLPFAPDVVCSAIEHIMDVLRRKDPEKLAGLDASFNPTYPVPVGGLDGWVSTWKLGLNEGPIILMIENHSSGLLWQLCRRCPHVVTGLRRAGFEGGWLDEPT